MKHLFVTLIATVFTFGMMVPEAEAGRFGGGGSFGMQRQFSAPPKAPRPATAAPTRPTAPAGAAAPARSSWLGPIAGLAAGLGLAALFSHLGLGEEFASFFLIALMVFAAVMLFRMMSRRAVAPQEAARPMQYAGNAPSFGGMPTSMNEVGSGAAAPAADDLRAQLDEPTFLRQAKLNFIRLQAANDRADHDDIREFTTPEVFAEICMQINENPPAPGQHTEVVELDAELVEVVQEGPRYVASVRFTGRIREEAGAEPVRFDEFWHLVKNVSGGGWLVAGIQQAG